MIKPIVTQSNILSFFALVHRGYSIVGFTILLKIASVNPSSKR